ncbi:radical SAM protein [bacterium]|nr:radical SAM protein [bacterium]
MSLCDCSPVDSAQEPDLDLPDGVPPLRAFYLYLSTGCNLRCRHCWITPTFVNGRPSSGDVIDMDLLREAVVEAQPLGLGHAKLTGGEPMLHPRFMEIARLLSRMGLGLDMETNGTLLTADSARRLKEDTRVSFISVSLDGIDAETHDAFRGVAGAFEATRRGLGHLVDAGYENVQVIMSVHRGNVNQIDDLLRLAADSGARSVKLSPVAKTGRGSAMHRRGEALDFSERMRLSAYVYNGLQQTSPLRVIMNSPPALTPIPEIMRKGGRSGDCGVCGILGILGTGHVALCGIGRTNPDLVYGRLGEDSVRDIWLNHPRIQQLRRELENLDAFPDLCRACVHLKSCRAGCVAQNYVQSSRLVWPDRLCTEAAQRDTFPVTRTRSCHQTSQQRGQ